jgi:hypothetical protein
VARSEVIDYTGGMNAPVFDRLTYLDALKAGGVPEEQARAHASALDAAIRESVATKDDLAREVAKLEARFALLDVKIAETKSEILRWMFAAMVGQTALIIAVVKLL